METVRGIQAPSQARGLAQHIPAKPKKAGSIMAAKVRITSSMIPAMVVMRLFPRPWRLWRAMKSQARIK
jgi:hypothetical protein